MLKDLSILLLRGNNFGVVILLEQNIVKMEIENVKDAIEKLSGEIEVNRKYLDVEIEKIKSDFKSLLTEHYRIRESVLEIKNTVERAMDLNAIRIENLQKSLSTFIEDRNLQKSKIVYPILVAIIMAVISFVAGRII
jgi:hypothetical protein